LGSTLRPSRSVGNLILSPVCLMTGKFCQTLRIPSAPVRPQALPRARVPCAPAC
jgi:hypothetical protein